MAERLNAAYYLECSALTGNGVQEVSNQAVRAILAQCKQKTHRRLCNLFWSYNQDKT